MILKSRKGGCRKGKSRIDSTYSSTHLSPLVGCRPGTKRWPVQGIPGTDRQRRQQHQQQVLDNASNNNEATTKTLCCISCPLNFAIRNYKFVSFTSLTMNKVLRRRNYSDCSLFNLNFVCSYYKLLTPLTNYIRSWSRRREICFPFCAALPIVEICKLLPDESMLLWRSTSTPEQQQTAAGNLSLSLSLSLFCPKLSSFPFCTCIFLLNVRHCLYSSCLVSSCIARLMISRLMLASLPSFPSVLGSKLPSDGSILRLRTGIRGVVDMLVVPVRQESLWENRDIIFTVTISLASRRACDCRWSCSSSSAVWLKS